MSTLSYIRRVSAMQIKPFNYEMQINNTLAGLSLEKMLECRDGMIKSDLPRNIKRSGVAIINGYIRQKQKKAA